MNEKDPHDNSLLERSISALRDAPVPNGPGLRTTADTLAALRKAAGDNPVQTNTGDSIGFVQRHSHIKSPPL